MRLLISVSSRDPSALAVWFYQSLLTIAEPGTKGSLKTPLQVMSAKPPLSQAIVICEATSKTTGEPQVRREVSRSPQPTTSTRLRSRSVRSTTRYGKACVAPGGLRKALPSLGGLEPPTFRLTAERANRLRHRDPPAPCGKRIVGPVVPQMSRGLPETRFAASGAFAGAGTSPKADFTASGEENDTKLNKYQGKP
ncbi:hypothetical protein Q7C36_004398 [Tachysurus vachellii]|uniref:Uncharacterized protein n=1 Tax=Tachysurus vachellii TaxID=175792 RepID=A0AA88NP96_TACVA|nr:hypothetical protein Q7C36_004398 [Tachysurus vachellii]